MAITLNGTEGLRVPSISAGNLVGQVCFFAMQTAPDGFLVCDGSLVSRLTYAELFAAIGTLYGAGDGSTTFSLPDLRGEFIRGWDGGRGIDSGRGFATVQADENKSHSHTGSATSAGAHTHTASTGSGGGHTHGIRIGSADAYESTASSVVATVNHRRVSSTTINSGGEHTHTVTVNSAGAHTHTVSVNNSGGPETRPRNVSLLPCIKY